MLQSYRNDLISLQIGWFINVKDPWRLLITTNKGKEYAKSPFGGQSVILMPQTLITAFNFGMPI